MTSQVKDVSGKKFYKTKMKVANFNTHQSVHRCIKTLPNIFI